MIRFTVNAKAVTVTAEPDTPLLWALREELQLTGTKFGCGMALCGAVHAQFHHAGPARQGARHRLRVRRVVAGLEYAGALRRWASG